MPHTLQTDRVSGEIRRDDVAASQTVLNDLDVTDVGGEDGSDLGAINSGQIVGLVRDRFEGFEKLRGEDVAFLRDESDHHPIGATELRAVLLEALDVFVAGGQLFVETGVNLGFGGEPPQHGCDQHEHSESDGAIAEDEFLEALDHGRVMRTAPASPTVRIAPSPVSITAATLVPKSPGFHAVKVSPPSRLTLKFPP